MIALVLKEIPRKYYVFLSALSAVMVLLAIGIVYKSDQSTFIRVNDSRFNVEVADTVEKRQLGLSGRDSIEANSTMLFVFEQPGSQCIWMKDMQFNIDIVWLSKDKRVISLKEDVSPATYPETFCVDDAQYVLEFAAGSAKEADIQPGSMFTL